ncbi:MAG: TraR/DksA family transcriptional regulator, partial [Actinomycetota bacterium]
AKKTAAKKTARKAATKESAARTPAPKPTPRVRATKAQASRPAPPKKTTRAPRPAKLDAGQLEEIKQRLAGERTALQRQLAELEEESFESTQSDITGEVGIDEDFADAGSATFDRERALSIHNNIVDLMDQMTRAIARIDDGTYGTCERCGRPIDAARLKALPHALLCMDCKRREERAR